VLTFSSLNPGRVVVIGVEFLTTSTKFTPEFTGLQHLMLERSSFSHVDLHNGVQDLKRVVRLNLNSLESSFPTLRPLLDCLSSITLRKSRNVSPK
jgi:hypothetical protein